MAFSASTSAFCMRCGAWRGSLGLEPALGLYLDHLIEVFREVRRVLRPDATFWLNVGDSYATGAGSAKSPGGGRQAERFSVASQPNRMPQAGLKPKDLMLVPHRLAIRLQEDGWYLRSDIIWAKRAPMPESVTDRPTSAHEHVLLLSKSARYWYDAEAVREESETDPKERYGKRSRVIGRGLDETSAGARGNDQNTSGGFPIANPSKRNLRDVWHLGPDPFPLAHFATFPPEIPRRAILAGTSAKGCCPKCGAGWVRVVCKETVREHAETRDMAKTPLNVVRAGWRDGGPKSETLGWRPSCDCKTEEKYSDPVPATVLDPFLGSGTTALVADRLGRNCIGIELNPEYAEMARRRLRDDAGMFAAIAAQ